MKTLAFTLALLCAFPAAAADLIVNVSGIRNDVGKIGVVIFAGEDYLKFDKIIAKLDKKATGGSVLFSVENLAPGSYAIAVTHDENMNGEVDKNFLGIPKEGVAASNNAKGFMGPPSSEDATFYLGQEGTTQNIIMDYF